MILYVIENIICTCLGLILRQSMYRDQLSSDKIITPNIPHSSDFRSLELHHGLHWFLDSYQQKHLNVTPPKVNILLKETWIYREVVWFNSTLISSSGEGSGNHSSTFVWEIPWTEEPGGLSSMGSQELGMTQPLSNLISVFITSTCSCLSLWSGDEGACSN